jgi:hypothetical protein
MEPYALTVTEASGLIAAGDLSPVELTESVLARIDQAEPHLNAFVEVTADLALAAAKLAEEEIAAGDHRGPLHPWGSRTCTRPPGSPPPRRRRSGPTTCRTPTPPWWTSSPERAW